MPARSPVLATGQVVTTAALPAVGDGGAASGGAASGGAASGGAALRVETRAVASTCGGGVVAGWSGSDPDVSTTSATTAAATSPTDSATSLTRGLMCTVTTRERGRPIPSDVRVEVSASP